jgi:hypothetical protein
MNLPRARTTPTPVRPAHVNRCIPSWLGMAIVLAAVTPSHGQSFAIDWFTIAGGGASSSGGNYALVGTIGQASAGVQSGGNFVLSGGFWSAISVMEIPGLSLRLSPTNTVIVSWPAPSTGFELQQNSQVATTNWSNVIVSPTMVGDEKQVILPAPAGNRFFRLRKP